MAIRVMTKVWDEGPDDRTETIVLLCLADHANDEGKCYPSITRIAERCRLSRQGTMNVLGRLEDDGWITKHSGGGRGNPNHYTIHLDRFAKGSSSLDGNEELKGKADKEKGKADKAKGSSSLDGNRQGTVKNRQEDAPACGEGLGESESKMLTEILNVMRQAGTLTQRLEAKAYSLAEALMGEHPPRIVANALREDLDGSLQGWNAHVFKDSVLPSYIESTSDEPNGEPVEYNARGYPIQK